MKFRNLTCLVAAVALVAAFAVSASAAQLKLSIVYETSYLGDFNPAPYTLQDGVSLLPGQVLPDDIHQFGLYAELLNPTDSPEESLGGILADIVLGPGLIASPVAGSYAAIVSPQFDPPPAGPIGGGSRPLFSTNVDTGDQDLIRIAIETDQLAAHGLDPGEAGAYLVGQFFIQWDQSVPGATVTGLYAAPAASAPADPWAVWTGTDNVVPNAQDFLRSMNPDGPTMDFDLLVPEPASIALAGLAMIGLLGFRRRRS